MREVIESLETKRMELSLNADEFTKKLGISPGMYSRCRKGKQNLPRKHATKIAKMLGVDVSQLKGEWWVCRDDDSSSVMSPSSSLTSEELLHLAEIAKIAGALSPVLMKLHVQEFRRRSISQST